MQILISNKFVTFEYFIEKSAIHYHWTPDSKAMEWIDYQQIMENYILLLSQLKPSLILADLKEFDFIASETQQQWLDNEVNGTAVNIGISKLAIVFPADTYAHISIELIMMEDMGSQLNCSYFLDVEEAIRWLYVKVQ